MTATGGTVLRAVRSRQVPARRSITFPLIHTDRLAAARTVKVIGRRAIVQPPGEETTP